MSFSHYPHACNNCYDSITFFVKHICSFKWQEVKLAICKDVWIRKLLYSRAHTEQRDNIIMLCILSPSKQREKGKGGGLDNFLQPSLCSKAFVPAFIEGCKARQIIQPKLGACCFGDWLPKSRSSFLSELMEKSPEPPAPSLLCSVPHLCSTQGSADGTCAHLSCSSLQSHSMPITNSNKSAQGTLLLGKLQVRLNRGEWGVRYNFLWFWRLHRQRRDNLSDVGTIPFPLPGSEQVTHQTLSSVQLGSHHMS